MPSIVIDNTAQFRVVWQLDGVDTAVNVIHGIKDDPLTPIDQARADGIAANFVGKLGPIDRTNWSNRWTLGRVTVRDLNTANEPEFLGTPPALAGNSAAELLPLNIASCVTLRTDKAGASYRGRVYVGGWTEGASTSGVMSAAAKAAATAFVSAYRDALDQSGFTMAVASRTIGKSRAVTSILTRDTRWDTQRRRIIPGV